MFRTLFPALVGLLGCQPQPTHTLDQASFQAELGPLGLHAHDGDGELRLRFSAWGREGELEPIVPTQPDDSLQLHHPGLTEWWVTTRWGVRQGWDIDAPPPGSGPLALEIEVEGSADWRVVHDGRSAVSDGWRYRDLLAWDATDQPLEAWMELTSDGLRILVDDAEALYPITVDPELTELGWFGSANLNVYYDFGQAVDGAGDINGDGYEDVLVGSPNASGGYRRSGKLYYFLGSASGVDTDSETTRNPTVRSQDDDIAWFVAGVGDVNRDGFDDALVSSHLDDTMDKDAGAAFLYLGSADGLEEDWATMLTALDGAANDQLGYPVAAAGDVNGDGYADAILGAPNHDAAASNAGAAYLFFGGLRGLDQRHPQKLTASDAAEDDRFGYGVAGAGDLNADGYDDIVVGAKGADDTDSDAGAAYVYLGSADGVDTSTEQKLLASDGESRDYFGIAVAGVGDVDGDGHDDIVVGATGCDAYGGIYSGSGAAYVYLGDAAGVDASSEVILGGVQPRDNEAFGKTIAGPGDLTGDGYDDIVLGSEEGIESWDTNLKTGWIQIFEGGPDGVDPEAGEKAVPEECDGGDDFGDGVAYADIEHRGCPQLVVGASERNEDEDDNFQEGMVFVLEASCEATPLWYDDDDGDGYGDPDASTASSSQPSGTVANALDCDDGDAAIHPGAEDTCHDGQDSDCDGVGGPDEDDEDRDGLTESEENALGLDDCEWDQDGDGLADGEEHQELGTDPFDDDSDGDGLSDREEIDEHATDPLDEDSDDDGLSDRDEVLRGADPWDSDSDDDGLSDGDEVHTHGSDPTHTDSDADGIEDGVEVEEHGTSPSSRDSDGDGLRDDEELDVSGTDPAEADSDGDGLDDGEELHEHATDPTEADCDGDRLDDGDEVEVHGTDPWDTDSDGDGLEDGDEVSVHGTDPADSDTDDDGYTDSEELDAGADPTDPASFPGSPNCDDEEPEEQEEPPPTETGGRCSSTTAPAQGLLLALAAFAATLRRRRVGRPGGGALAGLVLLVGCQPQSFHNADDVLTGKHAPVLASSIGTTPFSLHADGVRLGDGDAPVWLRFEAWGREGLATDVSAVTPERTSDRWELPHRAITEWWRRGDRGYRQGWDVAERPDGEGPLVLELSLTGAADWQVEPGERSATIRAPSGSSWRYAGLAAWDADGIPLAASMERTPSGLRLRVDDGRARYPILVDPELTETTKLFSTLAIVDDLGRSVSSAGDVDGDGYDDVILGSDTTTSSASYQSAVLFRGSATGVDPFTELWIVNPYEQDDSGNNFGNWVSSAGDINGDGYGDVLIGAEDWGEDWTDNEGGVFVYPGGPDGIDPRVWTVITAAGVLEGDNLGEPSASAGDVNGDGYDDIVVASPGYGSSEGAAYVFHGSREGIVVESELMITASDTTSGLAFAQGVSGAGDVNGDGYDDVVIASTGETADCVDAAAFYLYLGSDAGIDLASERRLDSPELDEYNELSGQVAGAGDVDGDGYDDVVTMGSVLDEEGYEIRHVWLFHGGADGLDASRAVSIPIPEADAYDSQTEAVAGAGDLDGDGYDDVAVGELSDDTYTNYGGVVYVFFGSSAGLDPTSRLEIRPTDATHYHYFGCSVASAGDVDGDGLDELLVGAERDEQSEFSEGAAYVFSFAKTWYADADGDGHGDPDSSVVRGDAPSGYVDDATDCDDDDASAYPGATEICGDGIDNDCDGVGGPDSDDDGDGLSHATEAAYGSSDCDEDSDDDAYTDAEEVAACTDPTDPSDPGSPDGATDETDDTGDGEGDGGGGRPGCASLPSPAGAGLLALVGLAAMARRRRAHP